MRVTNIFFTSVSVLSASAAAGSVGSVFFESPSFSAPRLNVFGLDVDFMLSNEASWPNATVTLLNNTASRPPFDGTGSSGAKCFPDQNEFNVYCFNADSKNTSALWAYSLIYNDLYQPFSVNGWTPLLLDAAGTVAGDIVVSNVGSQFYALSAGRLWYFSIDGPNLTFPTHLAWTNMTSPDFSVTTDAGIAMTSFITDALNAVYGLAFFGVPGTPAGQAHFATLNSSDSNLVKDAGQLPFQFTTQQFTPMLGSSAFPTTQGQLFAFQGLYNGTLAALEPALSFFLADRSVFGFVPDDLSATYIIDQLTNQSMAVAAPVDKTPGGIFTASNTSIVHLTPSRKLYYLKVDQNLTRGATANAAATWTQIAVTFPTSASAAQRLANMETTAVIIAGSVLMSLLLAVL